MISVQVDKVVAQMLGTEHFSKASVDDTFLDAAKQTAIKKVDAASGSWVLRAFSYGNKMYVQVQSPDKHLMYYKAESMAESKKTKIEVPTLKPRDPNYRILASKKNASGAHRDKKREMKNGEGKYKAKITFKEWLVSEAIDGSAMVEEHPYSVKILYKGKGKWPKLKGEIYEHDVLIGTFTRGAVQGGYIPPIENKFRTERAKSRFDDFADSLSIEETIEALFPKSVFEVKAGELVPLGGTKFKTKASVPAGKAAKAEFGVLGIEVGIEQPTGDTSKSAFPMPKYRTIPGKKQGA